MYLLLIYILLHEYKENLAVYISSTHNYDEYIDEMITCIILAKHIDDKELVAF